MITEERIKSALFGVAVGDALGVPVLTTENYKDAVLKAVNLGDDSDTTGAVTGGLAGLLYGYQKIPKGWIRKVARSKDIEEVARRFSLKKF